MPNASSPRSNAVTDCHTRFNASFTPSSWIAFSPSTSPNPGKASRSLRRWSTPSRTALVDALDLLRDVVSESDDGRGAALYVHDLDTGITADTREPR